MKNLLFFLWMLLYPLACDLSSYINTRTSGKYEEPKITASITNIILYFLIAWLLFQYQ